MFYLLLNNSNRQNKTIIVLSLLYLYSSINMKLTKLSQYFIPKPKFGGPLIQTSSYEKFTFPLTAMFANLICFWIKRINLICIPFKQWNWYFGRKKNYWLQISCKFVSKMKCKIKKYKMDRLILNWILKKSNTKIY